jgi:hypothetical protein
MVLGRPLAVEEGLVMPILMCEGDGIVWLIRRVSPLWVADPNGGFRLISLWRHVFPAWATPEPRTPLNANAAFSMSSSRSKKVHALSLQQQAGIEHTIDFPQHDELSWSC